MSLWGPFSFKPLHPAFGTNSHLQLLKEPIVNTYFKHILVKLISDWAGILATFFSCVHHFGSPAVTVKLCHTLPISLSVD